MYRNQIATSCLGRASSVPERVKLKERAEFPLNSFRCTPSICALDSGKVRRTMAVISMKALLESGVHFGHRTNKWDPRMKPYIFTERNGIHIIDLQQTVKLLSQAYNVVRDAVANGGNVLFVGTKRQAQETIVEEAARC